jgi:hypothetical protein
MAGRIAYLGNVSAQGLVLNLDAAIQGSYPKTGSLWTDISGNNNNGTLVNGPAYTGSDYGAIVFDGADDYVLVNKTIMADAPAGTFDIWFNLTTTAGSAYSSVSNILIGKPSSPDNAFGFSPNTGKLLLRLGNVTNLTSSVSVSTGSWQLAQGVWNSTGMSIYQNGSPVSSVAVSGLTWFGGTTYDTVLGRNYVSSANGSFTGRIGDAKVYNQALSQFQVWQNFNAYKSRYGIPDIVTNGLILNLDAGNPYSYLSGSSGTTWTNTVAVSSSISGTLVNGTTYSNGAMVFDGVDDLVNCGNSTSILAITNQLTFGGFVKFNTFDTYRRFIFKDNGTVGVFESFYNPSSNKFDIEIVTSGVRTSVKSTTTPSINTIYYLIGTYDGSNMRIYINGILENTTSKAGNIDIGPGGGLFLGNTNGGAGPSNFYLNGNIYNVQIYNRALTQAEITQNFNALRGRYGI